MRQLLLIAMLVSLVMYAGFVSQQGTSVAAATQAQGVLGPLQTALTNTGATLDRAQMTGWVQVKSPDVLTKVKEKLGWNRAVGSTELREAKVHFREQKYYLAVHWVIKGESASRWHDGYERLASALTGVGINPAITVQLEGKSPKARPLDQANQAMAVLRAGDRQSWSDSYAASISGRTAALPPGPFGVNLQVAVRRVDADQGTRVWVAWPALQQEY